MQKKYPLKLVRLMTGIFLVMNLRQPSTLEAAGNSPATVVLNGITAALGHNRIFLQISFSNSSAENISLVEGQAFRGIKLLAVDFSSARIRIDNCGQIQTIKICDTPDLTAAIASNDSSINTNATGIPSISESSGDSAASGSSNATRGDHLIQSETGLPAGKPDTSNPDNATTANFSNSHIYYWWLQDAKDIEQTRIATAQSVLAGEMAPQPLTPLTPPGTPAGLIGADSVYMEHGPGVLISDNGTVTGIAKRTGN